jgi:hypothetical protein
VREVRRQLAGLARTEDQVADRLRGEPPLVDAVEELVGRGPDAVLPDQRDELVARRDVQGPAALLALDLDRRRQRRPAPAGAGSRPADGHDRGVPILHVDEVGDVGAGHGRRRDGRPRRDDPADPAGGRPRDDARGRDRVVRPRAGRVPTKLSPDRPPSVSFAESRSPNARWIGGRLGIRMLGGPAGPGVGGVPGVAGAGLGPAPSARTPQLFATDS